MERDTIAELEIDATGKLYVVPTGWEFPYIYREAMEVQWDPARRALYAPAPREWSYARWFQQVLDAAREQGCELQLASSTKWSNIDADVKVEFLRVAGNGV
ncbi:hypothetical protein [Pseudoxanthomonas sacheonensis]|uniref:hypothetical protein n=1 Tax=Pseudoxanthomonas sacheonensis TaxID=443615 RepID=UPI003D2F6023